MDPITNRSVPLTQVASHHTTSATRRPSRSEGVPQGNAVRDISDLRETPTAAPATRQDIVALRRSAWRNTAGAVLCAAGFIALGAASFAGLGIPFLASGLPMVALAAAAIYFGTRASGQFDAAAAAQKQLSAQPVAAPTEAPLIAPSVPRPQLTTPHERRSAEVSSASRPVPEMDPLDAMAAKFDALESEGALERHPM